jgi:hypothetical protein
MYGVLRILLSCELHSLCLVARCFLAIIILFFKNENNSSMIEHIGNPIHYAQIQ